MQIKYVICYIFYIFPNCSYTYFAYNVRVSMFFLYAMRNIDKNHSILFHMNVFSLRKRFFNLVNALNTL